jgi:RecA/RadA recombinase
LDFINATKDADTKSAEESEVFGEIIDTGIYALNLALSGDMFGGLTTGRVTEIAGASQSGKSAISIYLMSKFLEHYDENGVVYLYETEGRVSESLFNLIPQEYKSRVLIKNIDTVKNFNKELLRNLLPALQKYPETKVMIVLDSLGNLASTKELEDMQNEDIKDIKADMTRTKDIKALFRTITIPLLAKYQIPFICTNHTYNVVGSFMTYRKAGGGTGVEYLSDIILEVRKDKKDEEVKSQNKASKFVLKVKKSLFTDVDIELPLFLNNGKFSKYSGILKMAQDLEVIKLVDYIDEEKMKEIEEARKEISMKLKTKEINKTNAEKERKKLNEEKKNASEKKYLYNEKYYTKNELRKNEEVLNKVIIETNETWQKLYSFNVESLDLDDTDIEDAEDIVEETEVEDEE